MQQVNFPSIVELHLTVSFRDLAIDYRHVRIVDPLLLAPGTPYGARNRPIDPPLPSCHQSPTSTVMDFQTRCVELSCSTTASEKGRMRGAFHPCPSLEVSAANCLSRCCHNENGFDDVNSRNSSSLHNMLKSSNRVMTGARNIMDNRTNGRGRSCINVDPA